MSRVVMVMVRDVKIVEIVKVQGMTIVHGVEVQDERHAVIVRV